MANSVYIHIPFCKQKCKYCSFVSFPNIDKITGYIYSLLKEIDTNYSGEEIKTLYFGGGTPSLVSIDYLSKILMKFNLHPDCEITLEMNPDDSKFEYLKSLKEIGINRLSLGSQTFDDEVLSIIGRRHNSQQTIEAVNLAKKAGFNNISLDLIYGLPKSNVKKDLEIITSLGVQHISTYGLKIEEGSFFYKNPPENLPDDDEQAEQYLFINDFLDKKGYKRYEISNFAQEGFESKHNLNYWDNEEYYGFGVSAHGYIDGVRYNNFLTIEKYLENPTIHEQGHCVTEKEKLEEEIFLGFRKKTGLDAKKLNQKFGIKFEEKYQSILEKFDSKYIKKNNEFYYLTLEGVLISNHILSEFLD